MVEQRENKLFEKIEKIIFYIIFNIDILKTILLILFIHSIDYDNELKIFSFLKIIYRVFLFIATFNLLFKKYIKVYITKIGIIILNVIVDEINNPNSEVGQKITNLYRELD